MRAQASFPTSPNTIRTHMVRIHRSKRVGNVFNSEPRIARTDQSEKKKEATDAASDSVFFQSNYEYQEHGRSDAEHNRRQLGQGFS
jgi:hypothetical protein